MHRRFLPLLAFGLLLAPGCGGGGALVTFPPSLTDVAPRFGPPGGGTQLTLSGTNFAALSTVTVGGLPCFGVSVNAAGTSLTCLTPGGLVGTTVDVTISTLTGSATLSSAFAYVATSKPMPALRPLLDILLEDADGQPIALWSDLRGAASQGEGACAVGAYPDDGSGTLLLTEAYGRLFVFDADLGVLAWYAEPAAYWLGHPPAACVFDERLRDASALRVLAH